MKTIKYLTETIITGTFGLALFSFYTYGKGGEYGALSLLPTAVAVVTALYTKRTIEALLVGVLIGIMMLHSPQDFIPQLGNILLKVFQNDTVAWIFVACGLMGSIIGLVTLSGGAEAFGAWISKRVKSRKKTLFATMGLGLVIFIDDYLNALTIGTSMRKVTDKVKVSRQLLAYIVDSTAAPICILLPFSTWAVFFSGLLEDNNMAGKGQGIDLFISAIPYMAYAWVCIIVVVLTISGVIPLFGKMRQAEINVKQSFVDLNEDTQMLERKGVQGKTINFLLPIMVLIFFTWYFDVDILSGALVTIILTIGFYFLQSLMKITDMFDATINGFVGMITPLATLFCGFMLSEVNNGLHTTDYVIEQTKVIMTPELLPATVFVVMAALSFATASFWGIFVVGMPIVIPLAQAVNADMPVLIGALVSASAFGSHACFYGDTTVLTAKACGITPMDHALTQLPYTLISAFFAVIAFLLLA